MLYIKFIGGNEIIRYVGDILPKINLTVEKLQADGDELWVIQETFDNLPYPKRRSVVEWFGEMANFIYHNLQL